MNLIIFFLILILVGIIISFLIWFIPFIKEHHIKKKRESYNKLTPDLIRSIAQRTSEKIEKYEVKRKRKEFLASNKIVQNKIDEINDSIMYHASQIGNQHGVGYSKDRWENMTEEQIGQVLKYFSDKGFKIETRTIDNVKKNCILWEEEKKKEKTNEFISVV